MIGHLTNDQRRDINSSKETPGVLAERYGVTPQTIINTRHRLGLGHSFRGDFLSKLGRTERRRIVALYRGGAPVREILEEFEIASIQLYSLLGKMGVPQRGWRTNKYEVAMAMRSRPAVEVAEEFGISLGYANQIRRSYGINPTPKREVRSRSHLRYTACLLMRNDGFTFDEIGRAFDFTTERARQICTFAEPRKLAQLTADEMGAK